LVVVTVPRGCVDRAVVGGLGGEAGADGDEHLSRDGGGVGELDGFAGCHDGGVAPLLPVRLRAQHAGSQGD
jgi:hypothetical protein